MNIFFVKSISYLQKKQIIRLFLLLLFALPFNVFSQITSQPNIIFIYADDLGYGDLSCYNNASEINSPNINSLAEEGVRFTDHYSSAPICSPSRRAFLTGRYQSRLGEWAEGYGGVPTMDGIPANKEPTLAMYLKQAGYKNGCYGKWNIGGVNGVSRPGAHGFDDYICIDHNTGYFYHRKWIGSIDLFQGERMLYETGGEILDRDGEYLPDIFTSAAIDFIKENKKNPFFVYLPYSIPHTPMQGPNDMPASVDDAPGKHPEGQDNRETFVEMVEYLDARIGDIIQTLKDEGLDSKTIVVFSSDNGGSTLADNTPLREMKQHLFEGGVRVPCIVRWPNVLPEGKVVIQPTIMMDLTTTFIDLAEANVFIPEGRDLDGVNFMPYILEDKTEIREFGFRKRNHSSTSNELTYEAYRYGDWKYVRKFTSTEELNYNDYLFNLNDDVTEADENNLKDSNSEKFKEILNRFNQWKEATVNVDSSVYYLPVRDQYGSGAPIIVLDSAQILIHRYIFDDNVDDVIQRLNGMATGIKLYALDTILKAPVYSDDIPVNTIATAPSKSIELGNQTAAGIQSGFTLSPDVITPKGSISFWMKADAMSSPTYVYIASPLDSGPTLKGSGASIVQIAAKNNGDASINASASFSLGTWHHIVATWDNTVGSLSFYVDGILMGSDNFNAGSISPNSVNFGNFNNSGNNLTNQYDGKLYDLQFYKRELNAAEINSLYLSPGGIADTSLLTPTKIVTIDHALDDLVTIHPNPVQNELHITLKKNFNSLEVYNISGELIFQQKIKEKTFVLKNDKLKPGTYLIQFKGDEVSVVKRFIKL